VIRVSTGTGFAFETRAPRILARDFSVRSTVDVSYKEEEEELEVLDGARGGSAAPAPVERPA